MCEQRQQLLSDLRRIKANSFELPEGENPWSYINLMFQYIGDVDPELRDNLIYTTFGRWICIKEYFNKEELIKILNIALDENHLFFNIGNNGDESVFTRTFSVLVAALVLYMHRKNSILDADMFIKVKDALVRYYKEEKDLRGYTNDMGWAHGAAHCADAFCELIKCKEADTKTYTEALTAIKSVLHNDEHVFSNEEDERIACILFIMIGKKMLPAETISNWIEGLCEISSCANQRSRFAARVNTKNFIRCLYFRLIDKNIETDITNNILMVEKKLNSFINDDEILV